MKCALAVAMVVSCAGAAWAQSKHYPKKPVDEDRLREAHSELWDAATHPEKGPYREALDEAKAKLDLRQDEERLAAIQILDHAIALEPDAPEAYAMRGTAFLALKEWARCADDFENAVARAKRETPLKLDVRRDQGICEARAGRLTEAEKTLADAASQGTRNAELWMRLGETRIALGKLDEAKAALDTALELTDGISQAQPLWLRAVAFDRMRQPGAAEDDVKKALGYDRARSMVDTPQLPLLGPGEHEYVLALSYADNDPRDVEYALLYFRRFLKLAPNSPWRKRAEEHLRDLKTIELPLVVRKLQSPQPLDTDVAAKAVKVQMPKMRACLAKLPGVLIDVRVTRVGPRTPDGAKNMPRFKPPPEGVSTSAALGFEASKDEIDEAQRCVLPLAEKIAWPAITDKDSYYIASFSIVGS